MAGAIVYDNGNIVEDLTQQTKDAEVSPLSPCGKPLAPIQPTVEEQVSSSSIME